MRRPWSFCLLIGITLVSSLTTAQMPQSDAPGSGNALPRELPPGHPPIGSDDELPNEPPPGHPPINSMTSPLQDLIENSPTVPTRVVQVTTLDPKSVALPRVTVELVAYRGSEPSPSGSPVQRAVSNDQGQLSFTNVPGGPDVTYRLVAIMDGIRSHSRPFTVREQNGIEAKLHVYPSTRELRETLVVARSFWFIEPRDEGIYLELLTEFLNLGTVNWVPSNVQLELPSGFTAFTTMGSDPDVVVKKTPRGVSLTGAVGPGQHAVTFSVQLSSDNRSQLELTLPLFAHTAEVRVATPARSGISLSAEGYPEAQLAQAKDQVPLLLTQRVFSQDGSAPPEDLRLSLGGLPVTGPGRLIAVALAALLAVGSLLLYWLTDRRGKAPRAQAAEQEAKDRLLKELVELTRAHRKGLVSDETFAETQQALVTATVRLERQLASN